MKTLVRILGIGTLVAILALMTLGPVTSAQREERGRERSEGDCETIGFRLREMVANGELTREEAVEQYRAACGERDSERFGDCDALGLRLREMVANGELTREEAGEQYRVACGERGRERSEEDREAIGRHLRVMVENGELTPEEARERYNAASGEPRDRRERPPEDR